MPAGRDRPSRDTSGRENRDGAGDAAVQSPREALDRVGLTLPSLRAGMPVNGRGFVELGGSSAQEAQWLAQVLNAAAKTKFIQA